MIKTSLKRNSDDDDLTDSPSLFNTQCPVALTTYTSNVYDISLDESIKEPSYYRNVFRIFRQASENDKIQIFINSVGGRLDSAINFINSINDTEAYVLGVLEGETHSAASMIALNCHGIMVRPHASMMIHHASFGSVGTTQNVVDHVNFSSKHAEKIIRQTYKYFLSEEEIEAVIHNKEIWLADDEIGERLKHMFNKRDEEEQEEIAPQKPKTKNTRSKKND